MTRSDLRRRTRRFAALATLVAALPLAAGAADWIDQRGAAPIAGDAAAGASKATVCFACHGPNGNATVTMFPRLAGQRVDYLYWELVKFKRGTRPQSPMTPLVQNLSDADMRDLAAYFSTQASTVTATAPAAGAADARGATLYAAGDAARGVPPCQGCHGADANGIPGADHVAWPALRGQHADYVAQRLKDFRDGKLTDSSNDFVMHGVAERLDDGSIAALAAYLAALPPSG